MDTSSTPCNCDDEEHKEKNVNHKHTEDECVHDDGSRHKLHQR